MLEWLAVALSIVGALYMTTGKPKHVPYSLLSYLLGSVLWSIYAVQTSQLSLLILNIFFIVVETIALFKWMKK